jgi:radical SAM protein with 4Fe4S-binding SPASM domain
VYCYAKTCSQPESHLLDVQRLRQLFAEARSLGVEAIQMSGGEVFTRPDIFLVLEAVREAGLAVDIPTKMGLSLDAAYRLRDLGIRVIQVSLDSANPEVLDFMVGVKNHHRAIFATLENLRTAGLRVRTNTVLTPYNLHTTGRLLQYLGELGNVFRVALTPYGRSFFRCDDGLFVGEEDLFSVEETVATFRDRYPHMVVAVTGVPAKMPEGEEQRQKAWKERAYCTADRDGFVILPDGRVTVCEELYDHPAFLIGDLQRQSIMEMWRSSQAEALLYPDQNSVPDGACKTCETFVECNSIRGRCWRDILKSYGSGRPHWPDPKCPKAPNGNRLG